MPNPKFSIITPVNLWSDARVEKFERCIKSVEEQTLKNFEWIIVDDGSPANVQPLWVRLRGRKNFKILHKEHGERVIALSWGLKLAKGDWICFLDSDDEYDPNYLKEVDKMIKANPKYKMFNFGNIYINPDGTTSKRDAFKPKEEKVGHELFGGGNIVNGTFVFHKSVYKKLGAYPPDEIKDVDCTEINYPAGGSMIRDLRMETPYDFSAAAQLEMPELRQFFYIDDTDPLVVVGSKIIKELGNPWGQDFEIFFKFTRRYHSKPFDKYLLKVHTKAMGEIG